MFQKSKDKICVWPLCLGLKLSKSNEKKLGWSQFFLRVGISNFLKLRPRILNVRFVLLHLYTIAHSVAL